MFKTSNCKVEDTPDSEIEKLFKSITDNYYANLKTHRMDFRKTMLASLKRGLKALEDDLMKAMNSDLGLNPYDSYAFNILPLIMEIDYCLDNMESWVTKDFKNSNLMFFPFTNYTKLEPLGVVLVVGSWNYPLSTLTSFITAIAAGNCVVIKPSEHSSASSVVIERLCSQYLDRRFYRVVQGAVQTSVTLTHLPFNKICFTGSTHVGKIVAAAAAKNLVPCTLELGGKCPVMVDGYADLKMTAKRIVFGKFSNCG